MCDWPKWDLKTRVLETIRIPSFMIRELDQKDKIKLPEIQKKKIHEISS